MVHNLVYILSMERWYRLPSTYYPSYRTNSALVLTSKIFGSPISLRVKCIDKCYHSNCSKETITDLFIIHAEFKILIQI